MGPDGAPSPAVPWRKVLWEHQPFPDNYVDQRFLEELRRNEGLQQYRYWAVVKEAGFVGQQLSCVAIFITLWLYMEQGLLSPETLLSTSLVSALLGYGLHESLTSQVQSGCEPPSRLPGALHTFAMLSCALLVFALWPCLLQRLRENAPSQFTGACVGMCLGGIGGLGSQSLGGAVLLAMVL
ncbi:hypothetical protein INR49_008626, partial [Caranx melampygus]